MGLQGSICFVSSKEPTRDISDIEETGVSKAELSTTLIDKRSVSGLKVKSNLQSVLTSKQIFNDESLVNVESKIASVKDIFNYTGEDKLKEDEVEYAK